jgi:hypothetical protein
MMFSRRIHATFDSPVTAHRNDNNTEILKTGWLRKKGQMRWFELVVIIGRAGASVSGNEEFFFSLRWYLEPGVKYTLQALTRATPALQHATREYFGAAFLPWRGIECLYLEIHTKQPTGRSVNATTACLTCVETV